MSTLAKTLFLIGVVLFAVKALSGGRLRELGRRLDRAINLILILLVITYAGYALWWLLSQ